MKPTASQDDLNPLNGARNSHSGPPVPFDQKSIHSALYAYGPYPIQMEQVIGLSSSLACHMERCKVYIRKGLFLSHLRNFSDLVKKTGITSYRVRKRVSSK